MSVCMYVYVVCLSVCMYMCMHLCANARVYVYVCMFAPARWSIREEGVGSPSTNSRGFARTCWAETVIVAAHAYTHQKEKDNDFFF